MSETIIPNDVRILGALRVPNGDIFTVPRSKLEQDNLAEYVIDLSSLYVFDSGARLPNTSATDDLGYYPGTFASASPAIKTYDVKNAGAVTLYARFNVALPAEYVTGETVKMRFHAGMQTTVASASATIDLQAFKSDGELGIGSDLVSTAATSINSLTEADIDFTIDPATLSAGSLLDCRVAIAVNDSATGTAVIGYFGKLSLLCDVKG
jgi:hypothetical protein